MRLDTDYQILNVGVRELPQFLSPGWACTDSEIRGVELLFESLIRLAPDKRGALYYHPMLAIARPQVIPLGRQFRLPQGAKWSDGKALGVGDLRFTLGLLQRGEVAGRNPAWGELLKGLQVEGDAYSIKLRLRQGFIDPLAVMSFKIVPARSSPHPTKSDFAKKPIGSGPFTYKGWLSDPDGREYASFVANEHYTARGEGRAEARIKEIRFYAMRDPVEEMKTLKDMHLALDLTAEEAQKMQGVAGVKVVMRDSDDESKTHNDLRPAGVVNRRIYFLAVNHRKPVLNNADFRLALARAINREQLLDEHFRKGIGPQVHRAINGPYPAGSWACSPGLVSRDTARSLDPFDAELAKTKVKQALASAGVRDIRLTVKYPRGDPRVKAAVEAMCAQAEKNLPGVKLVCRDQERSPYELRKEVEEVRDYDLAYYHYDFPDESFWLYPLLGSFGRGGAENYLGYTGSLVNRVQRTTSLRSFEQVREQAHMIHRQFLVSDMPFVPLWQIDPIYAIRTGALELPPIDPLLVFTRVEEWRVTPR